MTKRVRQDELEYGEGRFRQGTEDVAVSTVVLDRIVAVHDPWTPGMGLGDVDDWAAIFYLATRVRNPVIYIVSDVAVENPAPGGPVTRAAAFVALIGPHLLALNPNIQFVSDANWVVAEDELQQTRKIIICARVGQRDPNLFAWLSDPANLAGKEVYAQGVGGGSYNFGVWPLPVSPGNPQFNLQPTNILGTPQAPSPLSAAGTFYTSDSVNRRVNRADLGHLIKLPGGGPNNAVIDLIMMYGFMKNICLPSAPGTIGFLVRHANSGAVNAASPTGFNAGLGNNAYGIALYSGLNVNGGATPADLIRAHIATRPNGGGGARGYANPWVNATLNIPGLAAFMTATNYNTTNRGQDVEDMFCEALAVAVELFLTYVVVPPGVANAAALLANGFPNLSTNLTFTLPPVPISSPLWDLFTVACILKRITPAQIQGDPDLAGPQNSFPTPRLLRYAGLHPNPLGGKKRKKTNRKRKTRGKRMYR
jgi:hypothetical protein